jgi:hypothetical protein
MRDRIEELIWESQDGEISGADRTLLAARLAQDASARAVAESAASLAARLTQAASPASVPPELSPRIHAAIAAARREPRRGTLLGSLRSLLSPPPQERLAYLVAGLIGLLVGAGGTLLLRTEPLGPLPEQALYGTMRPSSGGGTDLVLGAGAGTLTLRRDGELLDLEIALAGDRADEVRIHGNALRIRGLEAQPGGSSLLTADGQTIILSHLSAGHHRLRLELADAAAPLEIAVSGEGRPLLRRQIRPADF